MRAYLFSYYFERYYQGYEIIQDYSLVYADSLEKAEQNLRDYKKSQNEPIIEDEWYKIEIKTIL